MIESLTLSVVDDDELVCRSLKRVIAASGYRVAAFYSAEAFLGSRLDECDCLILDVQMPGISGLELQRQLRTQNVHLPIIFITAQSDETSKAQALEAGAVDYLFKPFKEDQLLNAIRMATATVSQSAEAPQTFCQAGKFVAVAQAD